MDGEEPDVEEIDVAADADSDRVLAPSLSEFIAERRKEAIKRQTECGHALRVHELKLLRHELEMKGIRNTGPVLKFFDQMGIRTCAAFKNFADTISQAQSEEAVEVTDQFERGMKQSGVTKMDRAKLALWALGADGPRGRGGAGDEASDEERQTKAKSSAADTSLAAEEQVTKRQTKAKSSAADTSLAAEAEATSLNATSVAAEALAPGEFEC